jgi:PKD repeat protein
MKKFYTILVIVFSLNIAIAQTHHCGTDEYYKMQLQNNPSLQKAEQEFRDIAKASINSKITKRATKYTIPVVFHVIHTNGPENISREQILDQIRVLNEDYSYTNANKTALRSQFTGVAGSADIEFKLASIDVNGNCFDGVNRIYSSTGVDMNMTKEPVKSLAYWNYKKYLNIWVVTNIVDGTGSTSGTVLGYAVFPWMAGTKKDGIVVRHDNVGTIGTASGGDGGRTLSHEIGHWLGLYHTFQGDCADGDFCDDTPPVSGTFVNANCPVNGNSCTNDVPDKLDMWENYMDYSNGKCMAAFTLQQIAIMRGSLAAAPRNSNVAASNLVATGVTPQLIAPVANFTASTTTICAGQSVVFSDLSCKGNPTVRSWTLTGSSTPSSTLASPTVVYQTPGTYNVSLMAQNSYGSNTLTKTGYITVLPAVSKGVPNFEEGFENGDPTTTLAGFTHISPSTSRFALTNTAAFTGTNSYLAKITTGSAAGNVFSFTTKSFDISQIPSTSTPRFTFYCSYVQPSVDVADILRVYISTDCGGTYKQILERSGLGLAYSTSATYASNFVPKTTSQWKRLGIGSLTSLGYDKVQNAIFRIDVVSAGGNSVFLDNINMSANYAGVNNITPEKIGISLYPNPAKTLATLKLNSIVNSNNCKISLYDLTGREVSVIYQGTLSEGKQEFEITHPNNEAFGLFIVSIKTEFGTVSSPIIFSAE